MFCCTCMSVEYERNRCDFDEGRRASSAQQIIGMVRGGRDGPNRESHMLAVAHLGPPCSSRTYCAHARMTSAAAGVRTCCAVCCLRGARQALIDEDLTKLLPPLRLQPPRRGQDYRSAGHLDDFAKMSHAGGLEAHRRELRCLIRMANTINVEEQHRVKVFYGGAARGARQHFFCFLQRDRGVAALCVRHLSSLQLPGLQRDRSVAALCATPLVCIVLWARR